MEVINNNGCREGQSKPFLFRSVPGQGPFRGTKALKHCSLKGDMEVDPPRVRHRQGSEPCEAMERDRVQGIARLGHAAALGTARPLSGRKGRVLKL
jgi:hypothetical protein